ncbi:MAG: galactokinase, partial [Chloroflexi bacterium]|nr:galactokinase [Chloroflexota bacterium]
DAALIHEFPAIYGDHPELLEERRRAYLSLLDYAQRVLGPDSPVFIVRAPGRVNILGRHVDHQGGNCNLMAIDREILMAVHPRDDDQVNLHNVAHGTFDSRYFAIGDMLSRLPWDDWLSLVNSTQVQEMVRSAAGDWSQYVRAAILRLQKKFPTVKLRGMDMIVHGNIPIAAGLSSSSALVVATAEATVMANHLEVLPSQFVDLCGEGEWFVGTRGGSADHAAMKFGQKGKVAQVTFFDFGVEGMADFPPDYRMVICNSLIQARKSAGARDTFNHRVACYRLSVQLIKSRYRQYAPLIHHLRDINTRTLGVPLSWIYRILLSLPEKVSRAELAELLPPDVLQPLLATHAPTDDYPLRGVALYGLAECERSRLAVNLLANGQIAELGRLMNVSHDGDRIVSHDAEGRPHPYAYQVSNGYLLDLIADLESGDPDRVLPAQLQWQPGIYRCSTPEIDLMVDTALQVPGVLGAQLAGAGLGGCMMVLAHRDATDALARRMDEAYYAPRDLSPDISVCTPIAGSGVLLDRQRTADGNWSGLE